jgi:putative IMPACT (imprinted ancient) family translation regulator
VLVVVIRYYGGTKLGVPGLINAYKTTAKEVLESAIIIEKRISDVYQIIFNYEQMNDVMRILKDDYIQINSQKFNNSCVLNFSVRKQMSDKTAALIEKLQKVTLTYLYTN